MKLDRTPNRLMTLQIKQLCDPFPNLPSFEKNMCKYYKQKEHWINIAFFLTKEKPRYRNNPQFRSMMMFLGRKTNPIFSLMLEHLRPVNYKYRKLPSSISDRYKQYPFYSKHR